MLNLCHFGLSKEAPCTFKKEVKNYWITLMTTILMMMMVIFPTVAAFFPWFPTDFALTQSFTRRSHVCARSIPSRQKQAAAAMLFKVGFNRLFSLNEKELWSSCAHFSVRMHPATGIIVEVEGHHDILWWHRETFTSVSSVLIHRPFSLIHLFRSCTCTYIIRSMRLNKYSYGGRFDICNFKA